MSSVSSELARMAANQRRSRTGRAACHRTGPASVGRPFVSLSIHHTLPSAFSSIAGQNLNPMPQRLNNNLQALPDSLRAPRQINDQCPLPDPGRSPAQHRPLRDRQTNARIASGIPGTRRSITSSVASGVTSL